MKTLFLNRRSISDFTEDPIDSMKFTFTPALVTIEAVKRDEKIKSGSIPSQVFKEYCLNVFSFTEDETVTFLKDGEYIASLARGEDVQIIEGMNFSLQSRGVGGNSSEEDYFIIHSSVGNFEVNDDEYILFLYHARSIISNLRYSFDNVYHPDEVDGVNTFERVIGWVNPATPTPRRSRA